MTWSLNNNLGALKNCRLNDFFLVILKNWWLPSVHIEGFFSTIGDWLQVAATTSWSPRDWARNTINFWVTTLITRPLHRLPGERQLYWTEQYSMWSLFYRCISWTVQEICMHVKPQHDNNNFKNQSVRMQVYTLEAKQLFTTKQPTTWNF